MHCIYSERIHYCFFLCVLEPFYYTPVSTGVFTDDCGLDESVRQRDQHSY